jgi:amino acid transporter
MIYGMAQQGLLPSALGKIGARTRTPYLATLALLFILVPLAFFGSIAELASATVLMLLAVFPIVNGALFVLQRRQGEAKGKFEVPRWVPALGTAICLVLITVRVTGGDWQAPSLAGGMLAGMVTLYFAQARIAASTT